MFPKICFPALLTWMAVFASSASAPCAPPEAPQTPRELEEGLEPPHPVPEYRDESLSSQIEQYLANKPSSPSWTYVLDLDQTADRTGSLTVKKAALTFAKAEAAGLNGSEQHEILYLTVRIARDCGERRDAMLEKVVRIEEALLRFVKPHQSSLGSSHDGVVRDAIRDNTEQRLPDAAALVRYASSVCGRNYVVG